MNYRALLTLVVFAACAEPEPPAITVGTASFTEDELLGLSSPRRETLVHLTGLGLAVADSTTADLGAPLVLDWIEERELEILAAQLTLEKNQIGEDVLQARYLTDPDWELTVRHILVFSERWQPTSHREAAAEKAAQALSMLQGGSEFPDVETTLMAEAGGEIGEGLMPPGREGTWVPEFWSAALALQPGELSPVTETQYGFHVLRLENRQVIPLSEARSSIIREVAAAIDNPTQVLEAWMAASGQGQNEQRAAAIEEVRARSLEVPPGERAALLRQWEDQVTAWSTALGFRYGFTTEEVAAAALVALANASQSADIARTELASYADLVRARYLVQIETGT